MATNKSTVTLAKTQWDYFKSEVKEYEKELTRLLETPLVYAVVIKSPKGFDINAFEVGDRVIVIDKEEREKERFIGKIKTKPNKKGFAEVLFFDGEVKELNVGINQFPQIKLAQKDDGTNVLISFENKYYEVHGLPDQIINCGDIVKVSVENQQIHSIANLTSPGLVASFVEKIDDNHVEVSLEGKNRIVLNCDQEEFNKGDRVLLDSCELAVIRKVSCGQNFKTEELEEISWDDVAGLEEAKKSLIEAFELPFKHPEIYSFYNKKPAKGILLYGPPGCGKTLCAKAAINSVAKLHGKKALKEGLVYMKGPEILNKYIGVAEERLRNAFEKTEQHYKKNGYPGIVFIDEAEAILPERGSGKSSDIENTIVPTFLSLQDGLVNNHTIVILATNQPKRLDPAVCREGRIDRCIYIPRPNDQNAKKYFDIHMRNLPIHKDFNKEEIVEKIIKEIFNTQKVIGRLVHKNGSEPIRAKDIITGSMISSIVEESALRAINRDLNIGKKLGIQYNDMLDATMDIIEKRCFLNNKFDLEDYCDNQGICFSEVCFEPVKIKR